MSRAPSPDVAGAVRGRITVCARMRPLLENEIAQGAIRAPWALTENSIALRDRSVGRTVDSRESDGTTTKTRSELRSLDHLRRDESETIMDAVFGGEATTQEVYDRSFHEIVTGSTEGLNGAILAYGQTSSGKTFSISGTSAPSRSTGDDEEMTAEPLQKGIIHLALDDLFAQIHQKATANTEGGGQREYLVRMSYCELYMERVNDLLRKISPQSQNLPVKEDAESRSFYVEGIKEKIVSSPAEVHALLVQAEKRRRVAHTRFNEVSSRSHTLLTLHIECSMPLDADGGADEGDELKNVTKVGRLSIVDLAGNERMEIGTEYMAESTSINKSLFFLGKVIEKLSGRDRSATEFPDGGESTRGEHVPFRDSKLTRLLSVHLGGNSQTGVLVTLTPNEEFIEQSMTTLRFAQKASTIRCVAKPVLISKEHSLIMKQREIITQLHQQVRELKEAQQQQAQLPEAEASIERQQRVEQLQALTVGPGTPSNQAFVSKSREVDAIVTALHRNNDALKKQKATVVDEFKEFHKAITDVAREAKQVVADMPAARLDGLASHYFQSRADASEPGKERKAWEPAVQDLRMQFKAILQEACNKAVAAAADMVVQAPRLGSPQPRPSSKQSPRLSRAASSPSKRGKEGKDPREVEQQLREENMRLRASVKHLSTERERLKAEAEQARSSIQSTSEPPCKRSDGTGSCKSGTSSASRDSQRLRSPSQKNIVDAFVPRSPEVSTRPPTSQSGTRDPKDSDGRWSNTLTDCEPIVERCSADKFSRRLDSAMDDFDFEPIIEHGAASTASSPPNSAPRPPPPAGAGRGRSPMPPPRPPDQPRSAAAASDLGPRLAMDYYRQVGVRTSWRPGDIAYWRGQECRVVKVVTEDQPLYVVLRTPSGSEVTTDLCLLSEGPPSSSAAALRPSPETDGGRPLRLAPLGDLCIDRPPVLDRPPAPGQPLLTEHAAPKISDSDSADKSVARSASLPARGLSPVRLPSRQSTASRMRCMSPVL